MPIETYQNKSPENKPDKIPENKLDNGDSVALAKTMCDKSVLETKKNKIQFQDGAKNLAKLNNIPLDKIEVMSFMPSDLKFFNRDIKKINLLPKGEEIA